MKLLTEIFKGIQEVEWAKPVTPPPLLLGGWRTKKQLYMVSGFGNLSKQLSNGNYTLGCIRTILDNLCCVIQCPNIHL